jgi:pilus assembly protein Flp/PilA
MSASHDNAEALYTKHLEVFHAGSLSTQCGYCWRHGFRRKLVLVNLNIGGILMRTKIAQLKKKGQGLVEYALILVLIAIVVILILTFLGGKVNDTFSRIGSGLG